MTRKVDVIIVGAGFAGSIMGMVLRRLGRSVVILERGRHPRFAIGESSTPLANLLLEELSLKYALPDLAIFSKWGTWQAAHPEIACGLKRGFTFYKHEFGRPVDFADRSQQLLVAASPHDAIADTHWYRPDFDAHLAKSARAMGADLIEEASFELNSNESRWNARGISPASAFSFEADFVIDASGPRGSLFRHLKLQERESEFPKTQALFAHFRNVRRFDLHDPELPFPVDDAAVHHVFDGGWIWVLRFNNGIISAGVSATEALARELRIHDGAAAWDRLLETLPTLRSQFQPAEAVTKFHYQPTVSFATCAAAGPGWAMLPSAAGFVDPLFSTGFVLTLLGIQRLARFFESGRPSIDDLRAYEQVTLDELAYTERLVGAAFGAFRKFDQFAGIARVYFATAIWAETLRRLGRKPPGFLLADDPQIAATVRSGDGVAFAKLVQRLDLAGLADPCRRNWHATRREELFANAWKISAGREEIEAMLRRCGF